MHFLILVFYNKIAKIIIKEEVITLLKKDYWVLNQVSTSFFIICSHIIKLILLKFFTAKWI
jgi:hypothetical protein